MTDDPERASPDADATEGLLERADDLIAVEGLWSGRILHTAAALGLFERLDDRPVPAAELAAERDLDPDRTYRLLRAMAHFDVLEEDPDDGFSLTPLGELFTAAHPRSVRADLLFNRSPEWERAMLHVPEVVAEGGPTGFAREFGCGFFEYAAANPAFGDIYNDLIAYASRDHPAQVLDALDDYDLSRFSQLCDVGGGRGRLLCHLLAANPDLEGTVLDLPGVIEDGEPRVAEELGVRDRCTFVAGDMFEAVPAADAYLMKWILHNFDDAACGRVLATVREAAPPDGRLFVIESVVPGSGTAHPAKRLDIAMMVQTGGRERTREEYTALLESSGWEFVEAWESAEGPLTVLEAAKS